MVQSTNKSYILSNGTVGKQFLQWYKCKKQPIVQLEPYPCVNSTVDHGTYKTQFPCETWQSAGTRRHQ